MSDNELTRLGRLKVMQGTVNGVYSYRDEEGLPWVIVDADTESTDLDPA